MAGAARRHPLCQDPWHQASALAHGVAGSPADQGRRDRTGQQDRSGGMEDPDQARGDLSLVGSLTQTALPKFAA